MKLPIVLNEPPNFFNKRKVNKDLEKNSDLWQHVAYFCQTVGVYGLEDCDVHGINYYLVAAPGMEEKLVELVSRWKPGRLELARFEECPPFNKAQVRQLSRTAKVLRVIWVV